MSLFAELKRRNVFRVAAAYVVFSWLTLQIGDVVFPALHLPDWTLTLVTVLLAIGFLPALFFSWVYELTPEGVKKESEIDPSSSVTAHTGKKLDVITLVALVGVVAFVLFERNTRGPVTAETDSPPTEQAELASQVPVPLPDLQSAVTGPTELSIAILPFVNMSADADNEYFSDGISEELLNVLARIPELKVAARTSAFQFKGQNIDVSEIGQILKVANILEGSVRKSGNRVRVTAQLIKVDDGFHLWSDTYDRDLTDIFAIQDEIAAAIADALRTTLNLNRGSTENLTGTNSLAAYELYLKGIQNWHLREADSLLEAEAQFLAAIEIDPSFAKAHAGLALNYSVISFYLSEPESPYFAKAISAGNRALELDPENAEAMVAIANSSKDMELANQMFERAIELNPSFATAYQWFGGLKISLIEHEEAVALFRHAFELDPRSRIIGNNLANELFLAGFHDEALSILTAMHEFAPEYNENLELEFWMRLSIGDLEGARSAGERLAVALNKSGAGVEEYLALFGPQSGREKAADRILSWPRDSRRDPASPVLFYDFSLLDVLAHAGLHDHALKLMPELIRKYPTILSNTRANIALRDFSCRPDVFQMYVDAGLPLVDKDQFCIMSGDGL